MHAGQDHRAGGGRLVWASGSQVCTGNSGTLTANAMAKARKSQRPVRRRRSPGVLGDLDEVEGDAVRRRAACRNDRGDDADEHERRAEHREQEELQRGVDAAAVAPAADEEVHRHEHDLEHHEEQEEVEGEEHAEAAGLEQRAATRSTASASWCGSAPRSAIGNSTPVSTTRNSEMPSTPRCQEMPKSLDPGDASTRTGSRRRACRTRTSSQMREGPGADGEQQRRRRRCSSGRRSASSDDEHGAGSGHDDQRRQDGKSTVLATAIRAPLGDDEPGEQQHRRRCRRRRSCGRSRSGLRSWPAPRGATGARAVHRAVDDRAVEPGDGLEGLATGPAHERGDALVVVPALGEDLRLDGLRVRAARRRARRRRCRPARDRAPRARAQPMLSWR